MHSDENLSEDSLNIETEIDDLEYDIPPVVATPSLESVLWDLENDERSNDSGSVYSLPGTVPKLNSVLNHCILHGITTQIVSAGERVSAGFPTALANGKKFIAVGSSHGFVLAFDSSQKLCWCSRDTMTVDQGAISALAFNMDSTRLLVGYERGYISMLDTNSGDVIRRLPDAHAPQSAVLHLRYTDWTGLALCGDSAGCIFSLNFSRRLGLRAWDSKCLFSGARGEVCVFEPLVIHVEAHPLRPHVLVALATLSKVIVISIRPRLKVLFTHALPRLPQSLPLIAWQLVVIQTFDHSRVIEPVLAFGRGTDLHFYRVQCMPHNKRVRLSLLRHVHLSYNLLALHWLGYRHLVCLDTTETIRLMDVRTQKEVETLDISEAGLVYGSAHFKALATGGQVSEAFALAGEKACYNSLASRGNQLLILGTKSVQMLRLRAWDERLQFLSSQNRWADALNLAADEGYLKKDIVDKSIQNLLYGYVKLLPIGTDKESLNAAVKCCVKLRKNSFLCGELWESLSTDLQLSKWYFMIISDYICQGELTSLNPSVAQALVEFHVEQHSLKQLENLLLSLEIDCLDLNQVLKICKSYSLYNAWIHFVTKAMEDYTAPLTELLPNLTPDNNNLGNTLLVYISSCLAGLGYPQGKIIAVQVPKVKSDILRCLTVIHSNCAKDNELPYPYLRSLLKYNTRECLNVIELAFSEAEFSGELGKMQRERIVHILLQIVKLPEFEDCQIINLVCFVSRLLTTDMLNANQDILDVIIQSLTELTELEVNNRDHQEREQAWIDLMSTGKLNHIPSKDLLTMSLKSKCYRFAEVLYEQNNRYFEILSCYLQDVYRKSEVFNYMRLHVEDPKRYIKTQFVNNLKLLLEIDSHQTARFLIDFNQEMLEELGELLKDAPEKLFTLLYELQLMETALPPELAERYLELLCSQDPNAVENFIKSGNCRPEQALAITQKAKHNFATAFFLEQIGDYNGALDLLLEEPVEKNVLKAANLCTRSAVHLGASHSQILWLKLLKMAPNNDVLRQLLHMAAQHVHLSVLLDVINSANLGEVKNLLEGLLTDSAHETLMLETTFKLLGSDLHQNLAKALAKNGQAISVRNVNCELCKISLLDDHKAIVFYCGHTFHEHCLKVGDEVPCPKCQKVATLIKFNPQNEVVYNSKRVLRPDLEESF